MVHKFHIFISSKHELDSFITLILIRYTSIKKLEVINSRRLIRFFSYIINLFKFKTVVFVNLSRRSQTCFKTTDIKEVGVKFVKTYLIQ